MSVLLTIRSKLIPPPLEERFGKEKLEKLLSMVEEQMTINDIVQSGVLTRSEASAAIPDLIKAGVLSMSDKKKKTEAQKPEPKKSAAAPAKTGEKEKKEIKTGKKEKQEILLMTDSTADLPPDVAKDRGIVVIPLSITLDQKEYLDGINITANEFYKLLKKTGEFPSTSPPKEKDFHDIFMKNIADKDILGIFISRKMSKTFDVANSAKMKNYNAYLKQRIMNKKNEQNFVIELIDSQLVSMGAGLLVIEASDKIRQGWPLEKVRDHVVNMIPKIRVLFIVDTLKYLVKGGRIGRASGLLGNLFRFRPILCMTDGAVDSKTRVMGGKRAQRKVIELIKEDLGDPDMPVKAAIAHAGTMRFADRMKGLLENQLNWKEIMITDFGPTVGSHTGPGTVGIVYYPVQ